MNISSDVDMSVTFPAEVFDVILCRLSTRSRISSPAISNVKLLGEKRDAS